MPKAHTPRHGDVDDRTEEEEHNELEQAALHGIMLRLLFPSPAAFGARPIVLTPELDHDQLWL